MAGRPAELFLAVARRPLDRRDVVLAAAPHTLHLDDGARLSARFVRDDGGALDALSVFFESDATLFSGPPPPAAVDAAIVLPILKNFAALTTDANAVLELDGLPATWTGRLTRGGPWKVVSASQGELDPLSGGVRLARLATDLVLRLASRGNQYSRLVLRERGTGRVGSRLVPEQELEFGDRGRAHGRPSGSLRFPSVATLTPVAPPHRAQTFRHGRRLCASTRRVQVASRLTVKMLAVCAALPRARRGRAPGVGGKRRLGRWDSDGRDGVRTGVQAALRRFSAASA
ncbi:MAG: hypothetical protein IPJ77_22215 [Planctomycetes bacterium]|nr:hypothetical protein [Planctomycetota bacterium]